MKKRKLIMRVPDPFDGTADARLTHMGILNAAGEGWANRPTLK